jgi:hypothetical protein
MRWIGGTHNITNDTGSRKRQTDTGITGIVTLQQLAYARQNVAGCECCDVSVWPCSKLGQDTARARLILLVARYQALAERKDDAGCIRLLLRSCGHAVERCEGRRQQWQAMSLGSGARRAV